MHTVKLFENGAAANASSRSQPGRSHRILVADDELTMQELYAAILTPFGYQVDAAKDGAAAWEALCANNYDLLITDNSMPKVSGMELLEKLRAASMTLPAIMVSGTLPLENPSLKISAALLKPVSPDALLANVKEVLRAASNHVRAQAGSQSVPAEAVRPIESPQ